MDGCPGPWTPVMGETPAGSEMYLLCEHCGEHRLATKGESDAFQ